MNLEEIKQEAKRILKEYKIEVQEKNEVLVGKEKNNSTIYCHLNEKTNGVYIGQTMLNPKSRWGKNGKGYKKQKSFWGIIIKYGWENFSHNILVQNVPQEIINKLEIELIKYARENGECYNIKDGGAPIFPPVRAFLKNDKKILTKYEEEDFSLEEPPFIKIYFNDLPYLSDLPKKHEKVLMALLRRASYANEKEGMTIVLNSSVKKRILQEIDYKVMGSLDNSISQLTKGKILISLDRGFYQFNPYFFGVGKWKDISKLRLTIDYDEIKGRTFKTVCEYDNQKNDK